MVTMDDLGILEIFNGFDGKELKRLSLIAQKKSYAKGETVYLSRYRANRVFVIVRGMVDLRVFNPEAAVGLSFGTLAAGQLFGGASLLKPQEYTVTAYCQEDSELLVMEANDLIDLMGKDSNLGYRFMRKVAQTYFDRYERTKTQIHDMVNTPSLVAVSGD